MPKFTLEVRTSTCEAVSLEGTRFADSPKAPADSTAAGQGYVDASTLGSIATQMRKSFPSFGGVMLWDASQAYGKLHICLALEECKFKGRLGSE